MRKIASTRVVCGDIKPSIFAHLNAVILIKELDKMTVPKDDGTFSFSGIATGRLTLVVIIPDLQEHYIEISVPLAGHGFDEAAVEYIQTTTWQPGYQNGNPAPSSFLCPVRFSLLDAP